MKKKNGILKALFTILIGGLLITGCSKDDKDNSNVTSDESVIQKVNADDETRVAAVNDELNDEINGLALTNRRFLGFQAIAVISGNHVPCNTVIDSSLMNQGTMVVTFNGNNCAGTFSRTGSITLQLPYDAPNNTVTPWATAGCVLSVTFNQFSVTRLSNGKTVTINGTKYITNVNGGIVDDSPNFITPVEHHVTGMMQITFDNNTTRTWNIDRTRSISRTNNITSVTITGNATQNGISNVATWGINRRGDSFTISIPTPVVLNSSCNFHAISGVRVHYGIARVLTVTYGVDASGNIVTSGCPYGYRLNWINHNGNPMQIVVSY